MTLEDLRTVQWEHVVYVARTELFPHLTAEHFDAYTALRKLARLIREEQRSSGA